MMRIILMHTILLFISSSSAGQQPLQTIRGTVVDHASNAPLAFADVQLLNSDPAVTVLTDSAGNFTIKNVRAGRQSIRITGSGYEPLIVNEIEVSSSREVVLSISMKERTASLETVIIRPKVNKEQPLNPTASVSARMLSVEESKRYAGGFDDPARLVSSFAGVNSNIGNNAIIVRGNNPQALQWKLEGVEIPNPNHFADLASFGGGGLTGLSSQLLANSDFFSGAFPAEYNNALSGVFDIFMRKGNNAEREHTVQIGLNGIDLSSEGPFKKGGNASYLFNYRYSTLALLGALLPDNAAGTRYQDLSFKLNFPTKKAGVFSVWGLGLADRSGADAKTDPLKWKYDSDQETQEVKQYMGAAGIGHRIFLNKKQYLKSTVAVTISGIRLHTERTDSSFSFSPKEEAANQLWNFIVSSYLNTKFGKRHTNRTGFVITGLKYDLLLKNAPYAGNALQAVMDKKGNSSLLAAYTNSTFNLSDRLIMNAGVNGQLFTLNDHYTIEPRLGLKYRFAHLQSLSFGYGLHSRLERLNYYFVNNNMYGPGAINKDLGFSKSDHFVLGYNISFSEFTHLKAEIYYQHLFNIPVMKDSSFSLINQQNDLFFNGKLQNTGKGKNYGADITFEKYLSRGYYYLLTASLLSAQYTGGDRVWRNSRYNKGYAFNFLIGKEWQTGRKRQNVLGLNLRLSYGGGGRYSPVDAAASATARDAVFDETKAFSLQLSPAFVSHFTAVYKINKSRRAQEISLKIINATMYKEFQGFYYNYIDQRVDEYRETLFIPNLSYRIEF